MRDFAAEKGRTRPMETVVRVNLAHTAKAYDGADRRPFQGSVDQIVTDLAAHAEVGLAAFFFEFGDAPRNAAELKDLGAELYETARAAGI